MSKSDELTTSVSVVLMQHKPVQYTTVIQDPLKWPTFKKLGNV